MRPFRKLPDPGNLRMWRYYFVELPKWASGMRSPRIRNILSRLFDNEISEMRTGLATLQDYCGKDHENPSLDASVDKALRVKLVRESDGYAALRMTKRNLDAFFRIEGIQNLHSSVNSNRPVILLTAHIGTFVVPPIALRHLGFTVYPIASGVNSPVLPTRLYISLYRAFAKKRFRTNYIFTDLKGKIDRSIIAVLNGKGILWAAIDLPPSLSPVKRLPVRFLGRSSSLPSGLIQWGLKKNAIFITAWNTVEGEEASLHRRLKIDSPIPEGLDTAGVLQVYADRLSRVICNEPWQWMQMNMAADFDEGSREQ